MCSHLAMFEFCLCKVYKALIYKKTCLNAIMMYLKDLTLFHIGEYLVNLLMHQRTHECRGNYPVRVSFVIFDSIKIK